jgi:hypothetical protein
VAEILSWRLPILLADYAIRVGTPVDSPLRFRDRQFMIMAPEVCRRSASCLKTVRLLNDSVSERLQLKLLWAGEDPYLDAADQMGALK